MSDALSGTVKVPGIGPMKKPVLFGSIGVAGVIVFIAYKRHSSATASTSSTAATDPSLDPNAIDPSTGLTYGQEQAAYSNNGYSGMYDNGSGIIGYDSNGAPVYGTVAQPSAANQAYQTNADWTQAAVDILAQEGVDSATATIAIAHILGGLQVTSAQQDLFMQAIGLLGTGPPDGYPKPIRLVDTPATPAGGTTGSGGGTSPGTGSGSGASAAPVTPHTPGHLSASATSKTSIAVHWSPATGAKSYQVRITYQSSVIKTETVSGTSATVSGLSPNHRYGVHVVAIGAGNKWSPEASTSAHTPK